ncbi:MAG: porin [Caulobacteraceae bacterium]
MRNKTALAAAAAAGVMAMAAGGQAMAQDNTTAWKGAPQWSNDDVTFKVRGRILVDAVFQDVDRDVGTDVNVRSIRGRQVFLGVEGQLNSRITYKIEGGWVNNGSPAWDDVVIEYKPSEFSSIAFGNIKTYGLENITSTRFRSFMDQGAVGEITEANYHLGIVGKVWGPNWTAALAVQGNSINSSDVTLSSNTSTSNAEERIQYVGRVTFAPILTDTDKLHLGLWIRQRDSASDGAFTYETRANTNIAPRFTSTGAIGDSDTTWGAEFAYIHNSFSLQAEYASVDVTVRPALAPATAQNGTIPVGYIYATWWPTGEMRNYDPTKGEFGRPKIQAPINAGGMGGVELTARYDWTDLTDIRGTVTPPNFAGEFSAYTLGVNYYPTSYVRFMMNYTRAEHDNLNASFNSTEQLFQARAQLDF